MLKNNQIGYCLNAIFMLAIIFDRSLLSWSGNAPSTLSAIKYSEMFESGKFEEFFSRYY